MTRAAQFTAMRDARTAFAIAAGLLVVAAATAAAVWLAAAAPVRGSLGFTFTGVPARFDELVSILANNLRVLAGVFVACLVVQTARGRTSVRATQSPLMRVLPWICDAVILAVVLAHALLIGAGVGAYGDRMVRALLPHGPLELSAYSLALSLYVAGRRGPLAPARWIAVGALCVLQLLVAAALEVFASQ
jgi:hypothetical protein